MLRRLRDVNLALLLLRVGMGGMMLTHGIPKLMRGPDLWPKLGKAVGARNPAATFGQGPQQPNSIGDQKNEPQSGPQAKFADYTL